MVKYPMLVIFSFLAFMSFVGVAFADPLPWDTLWEGKPIQYLSIIAAELCGIFAGTIILIDKGQVQWHKATIIVSIASVISYAIGIVIWTIGHEAGIVIYNPINPFFNAMTYPLGPIILLLPEFIGTFLGAIIIRLNQKVSWKLALLTMAVAMFISFLVGSAIASVYLRSL